MMTRTRLRRSVSFLIAIPPDLEQAMAARISAHSIAFKTCHVAMLDLPFKVADVIAAAGEE